MRNFAGWLAAVVGAGIAVAALFVRLAASDVDRWHVDPVKVSASGLANGYRVAPSAAGAYAAVPVFPVPADALATALDAVAAAAPRTDRLAGSLDDRWVTYVQRSKWIGFPDYISVRILDMGGGTSSLAMFSRSRFGRSDLGVNRKRVENWLAELQAAERNRREGSGAARP